MNVYFTAPVEIPAPPDSEVDGDVDVLELPRDGSIWWPSGEAVRRITPNGTRQTVRWIAIPTEIDTALRRYWPLIVDAKGRPHHPDDVADEIEREAARLDDVAEAEHHLRNLERHARLTPRATAPYWRAINAEHTRRRRRATARVLAAVGLSSTDEHRGTTAVGVTHVLTLAELADALEVTEPEVLARAGKSLPAAARFGGEVHFKVAGVLHCIGA